MKFAGTAFNTLYQPVEKLSLFPTENRFAFYHGVDLAVYLPDAIHNPQDIISLSNGVLGFFVLKECPQTIFPLWVRISKRIWDSKGGSGLAFRFNLTSAVGR